MNKNIYYLTIATLLNLNTCFANSVDLSNPFKCPDISPNKMQIKNGKLFIGGLSYSMIDENSSSLPTISNTIFRNTDETIEIDLTQIIKTGEISMSFMKFSIPLSSIPISQKIDETILKYKVYERVTWEPTNIQKSQKISSDGLGCSNI